MPQLTVYRPEERIFAMFVGSSGDGKSVAAASFMTPQKRKRFDFDFDYRIGGVASAMNMGLIPYPEDYEYEQFSALYNSKNNWGPWEPADKKLDNFNLMRISNSFPYGAIIINSITSMTRLLVLSSHHIQNGKMLGSLRMSGPADFNFEAAGTHQTFDKLRSFPCHIITTGHIIDKYGKPELKTDPQGNLLNQFAAAEKIGEKLSIRDNLGANIEAYFDNVFKFSRRETPSGMKYFVEFSGAMAKNIFGIPPGEFDWTNKNFYEFFKELIAKYKKTPPAETAK